jgi:hypothetical protein
MIWQICEAPAAGLHPPRPTLYNSYSVITLASFARRRRALVAAFLPYLLLSVFVDFVHLHRIIAGDASAASVSNQVSAATPDRTTVPDPPCAICQWLRAGTGLHVSGTTAPTRSLVASALVSRPSVAPARPALRSRDLRGPPSSLSL